MSRALAIALLFVGAILLKIGIGCSQVVPPEVVDATNAVVVDGSECLYAEHKSRMRRCALEAPTEADANACADRTEKAFKPVATAIDDYRCAVGGECKP